MLKAIKKIELYKLVMILVIVFFVVFQGARLSVINYNLPPISIGYSIKAIMYLLVVSITLTILLYALPLLFVLKYEFNLNLSKRYSTEYKPTFHQNQNNRNDRIKAKLYRTLNVIRC